jgi:cysteine desulfurase
MIYFDNAATTAPFPEALKVFTSINETDFANPAANHYFGEQALRTLEGARSSVLVTLHLEKTHRCLFCSGASESDNLALKGVAFHYANRGKKIITDAVEHPAVLNAVKQLQEQFGYTVVILPVRADGTVDPKVLAAAMDDQTILVSIMAVNNEIGSVNDLRALAEVVHQFPKAFFHVDATQAIGKLDCDYSGADLLSFSGHKFGATKGTGCLVYKKSMSFDPLVSGGEQEYGFRAGTDNVAGDAALATALMLSYQRISQNEHYVEVLRDHLVQGLTKRIGIVINSPANGSPYVVNFSFVHKKASVVMEALSRKEIYVSSVSACNSKFEKTSYVLAAIGKSKDLASNSIRISFSARNTLEEVDTFLATLDGILAEVHDR